MQSLAIVDEVLTFLFSHLGYWFIPPALLGEAIYLFRPERRRSIGMKGWGVANRTEQPVYFCFLWLLHLLVSFFLASLFAAYALDHWF